MKLQYLFAFVILFSFVLTACSAGPEIYTPTEFENEPASDYPDTEDIIPLRYMANLACFMQNPPGLWLLSLYENPITDRFPAEGFVNVHGRP